MLFHALIEIIYGVPICVYGCMLIYFTDVQTESEKSKSAAYSTKMLGKCDEVGLLVPVCHFKQLQGRILVFN